MIQISILTRNEFDKLIQEDNLEEVITAINTPGTDKKTADAFVWAATLGSERIVRHFLPEMPPNVISKAAYNTLFTNQNPLFDVLAPLADFRSDDSRALYELVKCLTTDTITDRIEYILPRSNVPYVGAQFIVNDMPESEQRLKRIAAKMQLDGHYHPSEQEKLTQAIVDNDIDTIRKSIKQGTDLSFEGSILLKTACKLNRRDIAEALLPHSTVDTKIISECVARNHNDILKSILPRHTMSQEEIDQQIFDCILFNNDGALKLLFTIGSPQKVINEMKKTGNMFDLEKLSNLHQEYLLREKHGAAISGSRRKTATP